VELFWVAVWQRSLGVWGVHLESWCLVGWMRDDGGNHLGSRMVFWKVLHVGGVLIPADLMVPFFGKDSWSTR